MGTRSGPIHVMRWRSTLGAMRECGTIVRWSCQECGRWDRADLDALIAHLGEGANLWDRRPHCKLPGCKGRVIFLASPSKGTPFRPMLSGARGLSGLGS